MGDLHSFSVDALIFPFTFPFTFLPRHLFQDPLYPSNILSGVFNCVFFSRLEDIGWISNTLEREG